ncbi:MAG: hypothetical protein V2I63_11805 [Pseudomonadales bacterium]|jgi:hypothetical protein|nr:hypothetical protein [Pseudomonadales bacterium]
MKLRSAWTLVAVLYSTFLAIDAQAFGGMIAVGMSRLTQDEELGVSFRARARLETANEKIDDVIYYSPGRIRDELTVAGQDAVTIRRVDQGTVWMLLPQGMYMEFAVDEENDRIQDYELIERSVVGEEVVNGMPTTKYKTIYQTKEGKLGGFTWVTDDGIAVKAFMISESQGEKTAVRFEITELTRGDQDLALFEIPEGYTRFSLGGMSGMAGAFGNSGGAAGEAPDDAQQKGGILGGLFGSAKEGAQDGAEDAVEQESREQVGAKVRKGLRRLFNP